MIELSIKVNKFTVGTRYKDSDLTLNDVALLLLEFENIKKDLLEKDFDKSKVMKHTGPSKKS